MRTTWLCLSWMISLSPSALARQQVWIVDATPSPTTDFTVLQDAINTVASGDVLLVKTGVYGGMSISNKTLTIAADAGETPTVTGTAQVSFIGAAKSVRLQGLTFGALGIQSCAGTIWVESCHAQGGFFDRAGISVHGSSSVALVGVTAVGADGMNCDFSENAGPGLFLMGSSVHCYGCDFTGGEAGTICDVCDETQFAGSGVSTGAAGDFLMLSGCRIRGGDAGLPGFPEGCDIFSGSYCMTEMRAGAGLSAALGTVYALDSPVAGGQQRECGTGQLISAPAVVGGVQFLPGHAMGLTPLQPTRENGIAALHVEGPPHALVRMASSNRPGTTPSIDELRGTLLLAPTPPPAVTTLGFTDASGVLDTSLAVGSYPPGVEAQLTFLQVFYVLPDLPIARRIGQPPRGRVLGQATLLVGVDEAF